MERLTCSTTYFEAAYPFPCSCRLSFVSSTDSGTGPLRVSQPEATEIEDVKRKCGLCKKDRENSSRFMVLAMWPSKERSERLKSTFQALCITWVAVDPIWRHIKHGLKIETLTLTSCNNSPDKPKPSTPKSHCNWTNLLSSSKATGSPTALKESFCRLVMSPPRLKVYTLATFSRLSREASIWQPRCPVEPVNTTTGFPGVRVADCNVGNWGVYFSMKDWMSDPSDPLELWVGSIRCRIPAASKRIVGWEYTKSWEMRAAVSFTCIAGDIRKVVMIWLRRYVALRLDDSLVR